MPGKAVPCSTAESPGFILIYPFIPWGIARNPALIWRGKEGRDHSIIWSAFLWNTGHSICPLPAHNTLPLTDVCPLKGIPAITHPWCQGKYAYFQCQDPDTSPASAFLLQIKEHFSSWYFLFAEVQKGGEEMRQEGWSVCPEPALCLQMSVATLMKGSDATTNKSGAWNTIRGWDQAYLTKLAGDKTCTYHIPVI